MVTLSSLGETLEGRSIDHLVISTGDPSDVKKVIWMDCGIHAREWISPAVCLHIINDVRI